MHTSTPSAAPFTADTTADATADAAWRREILDLEERGRVAFLAADVPTLDAMWDDGFVVNSPMNVINDKARVLELLRSGRIRHDHCEVVIEGCTRHGDVVVVMGRDVVDGPPDGVRAHRRFTNVWQQRAGSWKTIARHAQVVSREPAG